MPDCEGFFQPQPKQQIAVRVIINQHGRTKCKEEEEKADFIILQSSTVSTHIIYILYIQRT